jgi:hypothetical protein
MNQPSISINIKNVTITPPRGAALNPLVAILAEASRQALSESLTKRPAANGPRFELSADGAVITDHKTGLMWEAAEHQFPNADAAEEYVRNLRTGGFSDWTVADVDTMQTILDRSLREPACDPIFNSKGGWLLTSTPYKNDKDKPAGSSGLVWVVYFGYGYVDDGYRYGKQWVRAVRVVSPAGQ